MAQFSGTNDYLHLIDLVKNLSYVRILCVECLKPLQIFDVAKTVAK